MINSEEVETNDSENARHILSIVSHDLKSPLNGILGFTLLLKKKFDKHNSDPKIIKYIDQILLAGDSMHVLIENILTMAKIEAGKESPVFKKIEYPKKEIKNSLDIFKVEAKSKSIKLKFECKQKLPAVYWDMEKIRLHVLNNLISNALKFTPKKGTITISIELFKELIKISIQDNGPGIQTKDLDSIFGQYNTNNTGCHHRSGGGHGYGLYNAKLFVESHNGTIQAENRLNSKESGALFTVLLPIDPTK